MKLFPLVVMACQLWMAGVVAVLAVLGARRAGVLERVLWIDTLALALMAYVALLAYGRGAPQYLDAALLLGLVAYAGTIAAALYHRGDPLP